jgi:hypothetical protein
MVKGAGPVYAGKIKTSAVDFSTRSSIKLPVETFVKV